MVSAIISTSSTLNDDQLAFTRLPAMNFSFGSSQDTSAYVPVSRVYTVMGATQNLYLNVKAVFTGSLSCVLPSIMAVRIA